MKKKLKMFFVMVLLLTLPVLIVKADDEDYLNFTCLKNELAIGESTTCTFRLDVTGTNIVVDGFEGHAGVYEIDGTTQSQKLSLSDFTFDSSVWDEPTNSANNGHYVLQLAEGTDAKTGSLAVGSFTVTAGSQVGTAKVSLKNIVFGTSSDEKNVDSIFVQISIVDNTNNQNTNNQNTNNDSSTSSDTKKEYSLSVGNDYSITFEDANGKDFELVVTPYTDHIKKYEQNKETLEQTRDAIKDMVKDYGDYIEWYEIIVKENNTRKTDGTFTFKIKMTDEMKKYKEFKMINIETTDDKIEKADVIKMKVDGDYLVGELPHLSHYALVGKTIDNPGTSVTISILGIGALLAGAVSYVALRKKNYFNRI